MTTATIEFETSNPAAPVPVTERDALLKDPGFGKIFTPNMVTLRWTPAQGWHDGRIGAHAALPLMPATAALQYGQSIFEGFKAYHHGDGSIVTFRPEANGARFQRSARRLALPELPVETFVGAADLLISTDRDWVPTGAERSLYLRPFMFGSEAYLGVRAAHEVLFVVIASPVGAYFADGVKPVSIWLSEDYERAAPGGTGAAKCAGNYAASLLPQQEAYENGCQQVAFVDAIEHRWVEELGGMNLFFVFDDGSLATPALSGTILEGITRDSLVTLCRDQGIRVEERRVGIDEWREGAASGRIHEVFACGTAAVITPVGKLKWHRGEVAINGGKSGDITMRLRRQLVDIQTGHVPDPHGWVHRVC